MTYQSMHTGPEVDAAVSVLSDVQDIRDQVASDKGTVTTLAGQTATNAGLAQTAATNAQADAASALTSKNDAHTSAQTAGSHAANSDSSRALAVVARNGAEQAQDSAWEAEGEVRYLLSDSEATIDSIRAEILRQKYGAGPYPSLDLNFVGAKVLDRRVEFSRASDATYWDALGVLQTAQPNEPRFEYDPVTGESLGLLVEGPATNLLLWSEDFTQSDGWVSVSNGTLSVSQEPSPDGTGVFHKVVPDETYTATLDGHSFPLAENDTVVISIFVKGDAGQLIVRLRDLSGLGPSLSFNLSNEDVNLQPDVAGGFERLGGGVYRVWAAVPTGQGPGNPRARFQFSGSPNGIYVWGAQLEEGSVATSYIKTEASQVTRAEGDVNISGDALSSVLNKNEGVLFLDYVPHGPIGASPSVFAMGLSNGTINNKIIFGIGSANGPFGNFFWTTEGVDGVAISNTYPEAEWGKRIRVALSWSGQDFSLVADGNVLRSGTSSTPFPDVTKLVLGGSGFHGSLRRMNCTFNQAIIYPRALSSAELQALTA